MTASVAQSCGSDAPPGTNSASQSGVLRRNRSGRRQHRNAGSADFRARIINPDIGFSLEVGIANDVPGIGPEAGQEVLGGGPGMMLYTFSELPNRKLVAFVKQVAAEQKIPLQFDFVQGFGDDAGAIKLNGTGVPVTTVLVPARSTHAHNGIIDRADFDRTVDLMVALIQKLDAATVTKVKTFDP